MKNEKREYWPFYLSFDLVMSTQKKAFKACFSELSRSYNKKIKSKSISVSSINEVFQNPPGYTTYPSHTYVISTHTKWTILWCNTFHCNGFDTLGWNVTKHHGIPTIHYEASDSDAFYQAGSKWYHRTGKSTTRVLSAIKEDKKWIWFADGPLQSYEDSDNYEQRMIKKRLNENIVNDYLNIIGFNPNTDPFNFSQDVYVIYRTYTPCLVECKDYNYVLERCG